MSGINVAIVGATGAVGTVMRTVLEERDFPVEHLFLLASAKSCGTRLEFRGQSIEVTALEDFDFNQVQIALFSAGSAPSRDHAPKAAATGCVVIDNTSCYRYEPDIPLIVPECNANRINQWRNRGIIANPNCSTIQMVVALKPLYDESGIERINVATYQAVSGTGRAAVQELHDQTRASLNGQELDCHVYPSPIAFNALPHIDDFQDNGYTREEMKMVWETRKILEDESIGVNPTTVRVPVYYGHSEAVHIETRELLSAERARELLCQAPGVVVMDEPAGNRYPTAAADAAGHDDVFVGRIREDLSHPHGLNLWVVSDNLRKGAATNSIQIAELWLQQEHS